MTESRATERPLGDVIDVDLPAEELERLARVDALLRVAAAHDRHPPGAGPVDTAGPTARPSDLQP